jgi:hypothetical protein
VCKKVFKNAINCDEALLKGNLIEKQFLKEVSLTPAGNATKPFRV